MKARLHILHMPSLTSKIDLNFKTPALLLYVELCASLPKIHM